LFNLIHDLIQGLAAKQNFSFLGVITEANRKLFEKTNSVDNTEFLIE